MRIIKFVAWNAVFVSCLYFGLIREVSGAVNVALFIAWLHVLIGLFSLSESVAEELRNSKRIVTKEIGLFFDVSSAFVFLWYGHWIIGTLFLLASLMIEHARIRKPAKEASS